MVGAGCNKPAGLQVEKTVEVVRDHEDGTGCVRRGLLRPEAARLGVRRE